MGRLLTDRQPARLQIGRMKNVTSVFASAAALAVALGVGAPEPAVAQGMRQAVDIIGPSNGSSNGSGAPRVGVESSNVFRWSDVRPGRTLGALARLKPRLDPLSFDVQAGELGFRAFHLTVYADPDVGRYAGFADDLALEQAGLKTVALGRSNAGAPCLTYMLCLMQLDAWSRAHPGEGPLVVVIDARREGDGPQTGILGGRVARLTSRFTAGNRPPAPTWEQLITETQIAVPDLHASQLVLIAVGIAGLAPSSSPFLVADRDVSVFRADAPSGAVRAAARRGELTVVIGADVRGEGDPSRLGAREAVALGAHVVIVTEDTARHPLAIEEPQG